MDEIKIYSTPRKLFHSLQTSSETSPNCASTNIASNGDIQSGSSDGKAEERKESENSVITSSKECEDDLDGNESVFSTSDVTEKNAQQVSGDSDKGENSIVENVRGVDVKQRKSLKGWFGFASSVILFFIAVVVLWMSFEDDSYVVPGGLVPT